MADETLDYKVNIDTSDISNQLAQIKSQIDQTMATTTFRNSIPDMQPQSFAFPMQSFSQGFAQVQQDVDTGSRIAVEQARNFAQTGRLGYQKFSQDVQNIAMSIPISYPSLHRGSEAWAPDMTNWGPMHSFAGSMGMGYDPRMSIGRGEYMYHAGNKLNANPLRDMLPGAANMFGSVVGGIAGTALGGPLGGMVGEFLGGELTGGAAKLAYGTFAATVGQDFDAIQNMRGFMNASSWRSAGGEIGARSAGWQAYSMTKMGRSADMEGQRVGLKDIQEVMKSFTEAGGMDFARTSDEFSQKLKVVVGNLRDVMHAFKVSSDEATSIIAKYSHAGVGGGTASGMRSAIATMNSLATTFGYTPGEMSDFAMRSGEAVRGTGIETSSAILGGAATLAGVKTGVRQGTFSEELVNQMGGVENMAATMGRTGYNWGLSNNGLTYFAAKDYYGSNFTGAMSAYETMAGAVTQIGGSIGNFMQARGDQARRVSSMSGEQLYLNKSAQFISEAATAFGITGTQMNEDKFVAYAQMHGMSDPEARTQWENMFKKSSTQGAVEAQVTKHNEEMRNRASIFSVAADKIENAIAEDGTVQTINGAAGLVNGTLGVFSRGVQNAFTSTLYGYKTEQVGNYELVQRMKGKNAWRSWDEVKGINTENLDERNRLWEDKYGKGSARIRSRDLGFTTEADMATAARQDPAKVKQQIEENLYEQMRNDSALINHLDDKQIREGARQKADLYIATLAKNRTGERETFEKVTTEYGKTAASDEQYRSNVEAAAKKAGIELHLTSDAQKNATALLELQKTEKGRTVLEAAAGIGTERVVETANKDKLYAQAGAFWNAGTAAINEAVTGSDKSLLQRGAGLAVGAWSLIKGATLNADAWMTSKPADASQQDSKRLETALEQDALRVQMLQRYGDKIDLKEDGSLTDEAKNAADNLIKKDSGQASLIELSAIRQALVKDGIKIKD